MSSLLARLARTLTQHWKRGLAGAIVVLVLIGAAAGAGGESADDFSIPGTESQQALDLFRDHSPAFAGADSTIVFSVDQRQARRSREPRRDRGCARQDQGAARTSSRSPIRSPRAAPCPRTGGSPPTDVRYSLEPDELDKEDGEELLAAAETAEQGGVDVSARGVLIDLASEQEAPVGELIGVAIALDPADRPLPLARRDGRDARRRADRRGGRADAAGGAGRSRWDCRRSRA